MSDHIQGLTSEEVTIRSKAGLVNHAVESASPSYTWIAIRNAFNLINIFLLPLLIVLMYFQKYQDVFVMSTFAVINSIVGAWDEIRIKKRLDRIQVDYAKQVTAIRDGKPKRILATEIVIDDILKVNEAEGLPTDGEVIAASNLQVDESLLTGESNYISKEPGDKVIGGSFIVAGECYYRVSSVGKDSYVNKLGFQSKSFRKEKSQLQKIGDRLTVFFITASVVFGIGAFLSARSQGLEISDSVIPLTTVVSLIIPQTLIFLFTFTFSISVVKLSQLGALVQRPSAVESLAKLDVLCFDKTGTITSGDMQVVNTKFWNIEPAQVAEMFNYIQQKAYGRNATFEVTARFFNTITTKELEVDEYTQSPFNSKTKLAINQLRSRDKYWQLVYGAPTSVMEYIDADLKDEVAQLVSESEADGNRHILGVVNQSEKDLPADKQFTSKLIWLIALQEEINPGLTDTIAQFQRLGTELKIISGDSAQAIGRALNKLGVDVGKAIDLSVEKVDLAKVASEYSIFARAKPEDKLVIIKALQAKGLQVGMVGDGVNDVLALKLSNLSMAMESGASIAQDVADIVLLGNNFNLVPKIIYEGDNVVANLKFMNLLFLNKTFHAVLFALICILLARVFPLLPTSILIYSFLATSLPSYVVAFLRRPVSTSKSFWADVLPSSVIGGLVGAMVSFVILFRQEDLLGTAALNTAVMYGTFIFGLMFSLHQLYRNGYVQELTRAVLIFFVLSVIGIGASLVPIINTYYTVVSLDINLWVELLLIAFAGYIAYWVVEKIITILTKP